LTPRWENWGEKEKRHRNRDPFGRADKTRGGTKIRGKTMGRGGNRGKSGDLRSAGKEGKHLPGRVCRAEGAMERFGRGRKESAVKVVGTRMVEWRRW
jgi:hypothetical protein